MMKILLMIAILMMFTGCAVTGEDYYYYSESYAPYYPTYYYGYNNPAFYDLSYGLNWPFYPEPYIYNNYYYTGYGYYHHWHGNGWNNGHHH